MVTGIGLYFFAPSGNNSPPSLPVPNEAVDSNVLDSQPTINSTTEQPEAPEPNRGATEIFMTASAYCSCYKCCGKLPSDPGYGITASGVKVNALTVSADWNILPKGTEIYIDGLGRRIVQDRGGAIVGNRLDIWFPSHEAALAFGVRTAKVRVLD